MGPLDRPSGLAVLAILCLTGFLPPETRGESMAGCAILGSLLVALTWRQPLPSGGRVALLVLAAASWPVALSASAPGSTVLPFAVAFIAAAIGIHSVHLAPALGRGVRVPAVLATVGALLSLGGVAQWMWWLESKAAWVAETATIPDRDLILARLQEGRAFEPFATPAALGGYLALVLPVTVGLAVTRRGRVRSLLLVVAGLQAAGILATRSGTAAAALAGAGLLALVLRPRAWKRLAVAVGLAIVLMAGVVALRGVEILDLTRWDHPWRLRAGNYRVACDVVRDHPWLGVGPGGFGEVFPMYRGPADNEAQHVHHLPLELAAETGVIPGAVLSVVFFALFLGPVFRTRREVDPIRQGMAVGLAAFALHNLVDFTAYFPSILWTAALLRALAVDPVRYGKREPLTLGTSVTAGAVLACMLAASIAAGLAGLSWNARNRARLQVAQGDLEAASARAARAVNLAPWDVNSRLLLAQVVLAGCPVPPEPAESCRREALRHADLAVRLSPVRPAARAVRARARMALGDSPGALADLVEAARLYPSREEYARTRDELAAELQQRLPLEGDAP